MRFKAEIEAALGLRIPLATPFKHMVNVLAFTGKK